MARYQVCERSATSDWSLVRNDREVLDRFDTTESAREAAIKYITDRNCNNALTKDEKLHSIECFMRMNEAIFLGMLDGEEWYMTYPKDIKNKDGDITHSKGSKVNDPKFFLLEGKDEVSIRAVPGT